MKEPITGPRISPTPTAVSINAIYLSWSWGNSIDTIAYDVVCIEQEAIPWQNRNKKARQMKRKFDLASGVAPKPSMAIHIKHSPKIKIFFLPTLVISLPTMGDPMQAKLMLAMPIVFTFLFLNFPSGLVIYWLVNNVLSIGQQLYINKYTA